MTTKTPASAARLLALIRERRDRSPDIGPDCAGRCLLPTVRREDPKIYASNWTITYLTGCAACNEIVEAIAHDMQREYLLE